MNLKNKLNLLCLPLITFSMQTVADYKLDISYNQLQSELNALTPNGSGVKVTQVEASSVASTDPNFPIFAPNPDSTSFTGKTFSYPAITCGIPPCNPSLFSSHATGVANVFYGNAISMAEGINDIHSYEVNQWVNSTFISSRNGEILGATISDRRIANHSWDGNDDSAETIGNVLRLVDRQVVRNEYMQVAATTTRPLLGNAYNAIAVGLSNGPDLGSIDIDNTYVAGRSRPDIVAPAANVSRSTPIISAAAAILVETGHQGGNILSNGSRTITPDTGSAFTVYNAERSETVKAALMAGADRQTANSSGFGDITDYRSEDHQSANGLDTRYGAGQVNIFNSYHIITAGEQNSLEDGGDNNGQIDFSGYDYDANFGGSDGSNNIATYAFTATTNETLSASLVWNIDINNDGSLTSTMHHLKLSLLDATENIIIASSDSLLDNTQNIYINGLTEGHDYLIETTALEPGAFNWDYSLAWNRSAFTTPVPLPIPFWLFGSALAVLFGYQRKQKFLE